MATNEMELLRKIATPSRFAMHIAPDLLGREWKFYPWIAYMESRILDALRQEGRRIIIVSVPPQNGKALHVDTPIPTPTGWVRMGDIKTGDIVIGHDGNPVRVLHAHDPYEAELWRVTFEDRSTLLCDGDHLWSAVSRDIAAYRQGNKIWGTDWPTLSQTLSTREMAATCDRPDKGQRWRIPNGHLDLPDIDLPVDPYLLGYWLGDGSSASGRVTCGAVDLDHVTTLGDVQSIREYKPGVFTICFRGLSTALAQIGVRNNKHIPAMYLRAGTQQRQALLAGLMDADGGMSGATAEIAQQSKELADDIAELIVSLGGRTSTDERRPKIWGRETGAVCYRQKVVTTFNPFRLVRKAEKWNTQSEKARWSQRSQRVVRSVVPIGISSTVRCITVDSVHGLYLAGEQMVPTHNTTYCGMFLPAWFLGMNPRKQVIFIAYNDEYATVWGTRVRSIMERWGYLFGVGLSKKMTALGNWKMAGEFGGMMSAGIMGGITGNPGDLIIIDDVIKTMEDANSATAKRKHLEEWDGSIQTRFQDDTKVLICATRWAEDDLSGRLIERSREPGYNGPPVEVIAFPAFAEPLDEEMRTDEELAEWRDVIGRKYDDHLEGQHSRGFYLEKRPPSMDAFTFDALYQCKPGSREGGMFPPGNWQSYRHDEIPEMAQVVRCWDMAATEGGGDWTVGTKMGISVDGRLFVLDRQRFRKSPDQVEAEILRFARSDGPMCPILLEEEKGGSGKATTAAFKRNKALLGFRVEAAKVEGSKEQRALPYSTEQNKRNVYLPEGAPWLAEWIDEHKKMMGDGRRPRHDDQIDTAAHAVNYLLRFNIPSTFIASHEMFERAPLGEIDVEAFIEPREIWAYP